MDTEEEIEKKIFARQILYNAAKDFKNKGFTQYQWEFEFDLAVEYLNDWYWCDLIKARELIPNEIEHIGYMVWRPTKVWK